MASIGISVRSAVIDDVEHGTIGTLTIDNPERRNAMNSAMYLALPDAMDALAAEPNIRCIIIQGAGNEAFSAGSDISEFPNRRMGRTADGNSKAEGYDNTEHKAWAAIANARVPVIAAIHGPCRGGGIAIALHADIRIAATDATFAVPPASLGLAYPIEATERLVSLVGPATAKSLLFTAQVLDAEAALRVGLVQEVLPKTELDAHIDRVTHRIARLAPLSIKTAKLQVDALSTAAGASVDLANMKAHAKACYDSDDFKEGVAAFMQKRRPHFRGR
ncbi:MAG: enoyl-CoA hydratase [Acidimicrobiaceae bacterium]|nr:enoyl-CoA hydratase [Acidimicrobiaceae bacterium]MBT5581894.1 enoyl-CoA hydratase [Acidimicrobiaceae bacterium]MBT5849467.1 enoyl-CoA hydratase [Acidimicrobiaceae bacterium]